MDLFQAKLNTMCVIKSVNISDFETKIRLMELGLTFGTKIKVKHKSGLKKTLLVIFAGSCFTLKDNLAKQIEVDYA